MEGFLFAAKQLSIKILTATGLFIGFDMAHEHDRIAVLLIAIVGIDTILGTLVALKLKQFSSWGASRFTTKIVYYGLSVITVWIVSQLLKINDDLLIFMMSYLVIIEATSNLEKLAILGVPIPQKILKFINSQFENVETAKAAWIDRSNSCNK